MGLKVDITEERISEFEDIVIKTSQNQAQKTERLGENISGISVTCGTISSSVICV